MGQERWKVGSKTGGKGGGFNRGKEVAKTRAKWWSIDGGGGNQITTNWEELQTNQSHK